MSPGFSRMEFSMRGWVLRLPRGLQLLAKAQPSVLPSVLLNDVGTLVVIVSQLNTRLACVPVKASMASQLATHDSGPDGSLLLSCVALSFTTPRRFIPAHSTAS